LRFEEYKNEIKNKNKKIKNGSVMANPRNKMLSNCNEIKERDVLQQQ